jgi:hypothetical protein
MGDCLGNCQNCVHSKFDEQWGEFKCMKYHRRIYILLSSEECANYEKDPTKKLPVETKKNTVKKSSRRDIRRSKLTRS